MTPLIFVHANTKREVIVTKEMVWNIMWSAAHQCTHLVSLHGAIIPVAESVEKARFLVYGTKTESPSSPVGGVAQPIEAKEADKDGV